MKAVDEGLAPHWRKKELNRSRAEFLFGCLLAFDFLIIVIYLFANGGGTFPIEFAMGLIGFGGLGMVLMVLMVAYTVFPWVESFNIALRPILLGVFSGIFSLVLITIITWIVDGAEQIVGALIFMFAPALMFGVGGGVGVLLSFFPRAYSVAKWSTLLLLSVGLFVTGVAFVIG